MRILVVTHYFPEHGGGIEIVAGQLASRLAGRGVEIEWFASREQGMPTAAPGARPVRAFNLAETAFGIPYPVWGPVAFARLAAAIRRCDILHVHDALYTGNVGACLIARRHRKPVLVTQHVGLVPYRSRVVRALMQAGNRFVAAPILRRADRVVFCSRTTERYFAAFAPSCASAFVPNGVDTALCHPLSDDDRRSLRRQLGWPADRLVFLFVGRYVEKKGLGVLRQLTARFPEVVWVFAGWGRDDPASWRAPNVVALGRRTPPEVARLYQAADLLVLPSVGEGFPLVVQESMACGTPAAISSETAAAHPGLEPFVWHAEPTAAAFDEMLRDVIAAPGRVAERRGDVAAFAARTWSWDRCADATLDLFRAILRGGTATAAVSASG